MTVQHYTCCTVEEAKLKYTSQTHSNKVPIVFSAEYSHEHRLRTTEENFRIGDIVEVHLRYKMWDSKQKLMLTTESEDRHMSSKVSSSFETC